MPGCVYRPRQGVQEAFGSSVEPQRPPIHPQPSSARTAARCRLVYPPRWWRGAHRRLRTHSHDQRDIPGIGPEWLRRLGIYVLAGVMFLRGLGRYFMNSGATSEFQTWKSALYSPLCIGLGLLAVTVGQAATGRARDLSSVRE